MVKILLGIPTPFDFKLVEKYQKGLEFDIIKPKYYSEIQAYTIIRDHFLKNTEYTHLGIACSDIVLFDSAVKKIQEDIIKFDYPVITGMMNLSLEFLNVYNITRNIVDPRQMEYDWYCEGDKYKELQKVGFSGFPLMVIRRDVVQKIPFEKTSDLLGIKDEINCLDISFCWRLYQNDIPIYADTIVKLLHLKEMNDKSQLTKVGIEKPYTEIIKLPLN